MLLMTVKKSRKNFLKSYPSVIQDYIRVPPSMSVLRPHAMVISLFTWLALSLALVGVGVVNNTTGFNSN